MDKLQKEQGLADLAESRQSGALTSIGAWLMAVGEKVRIDSIKALLVLR